MSRAAAVSPEVEAGNWYLRARALMQIATAEHLKDQSHWSRLPVAMTSLTECAKMGPDRFAEGLEPRASGKAAIHPLANREELKVFRQNGQRHTKPLAAPPMSYPVVLIYLPPTDAPDPDALKKYVEQYLEEAVEAGVGFAVSRRLVEGEAGAITRVGVEQFQEFDENGSLLKPGKRKSPARWTGDGAGPPQKALTCRVVVESGFTGCRCPKGS